MCTFLLDQNKISKKNNESNKIDTRSKYIKDLSHKMTCLKMEAFHLSLKKNESPDEKKYREEMELKAFEAEMLYDILTKKEW